MENLVMIHQKIFNNKKVLITGHTGFKGSWLSIWMKILGAEVIGIALEPYSEKDNYVVSGLSNKIISFYKDVRDFSSLKKIFQEYEPEFVFHLAAQPLVRESYNNPKETLDVNIGGTVNVLECCRLIDSVKVIVNVTSDKCYDNKEWIWGYRENDRLGGHDPYSCSKAGSEIVTQAYRNSFFNPCDFINHGKSLSSARAGNVIGGGDWRKDRIIPDCIRALEKSEPIIIRNSKALRPFQHVLEPLYGYLMLASKMAENLEKYSGAWNFGPGENNTKNVGTLADSVIRRWGEGTRQHGIENNALHEANILRLNSTKSRVMLGVKPIWDFEQTVAATVDWYKKYTTENMYRFCEQQIESYLKTVISK